jgi:two-component system, cell cycle sensor histidine kinase and response regulator CckA
MEKKNYHIGVITLLAGILTGLVVLILPLGFFLVSYYSMLHALDTEAEINARIVSSIIGSNPEFWEFEQVRLREYLARRPWKGVPETRRVLNAKNELIAESADKLEPPVVMQTHELADAGVIVGRIEIARSLRPILKQTGLIALLVFPFGLGAFLILRILPVSRMYQAERALRESEEKYRKIFENVVTGIAQVTPNGHYLSINPAFARMHGCESPEEMIRSIADAVYQPYVRPEEQKKLISLIDAQGYVEGFEAERYRTDGGRFWVLMDARAVRDAEGKPLYYEVTIQDITSRKKAEEALRKSEEQYRRIVETTAEGICVVDQDRSITYVNRRCSEMFGYSLEEMKGAKLFSFIFQEDLPDALAKRDKRELGVSDRFERRFCRKDGSTLWVHASVTSIVDDEGRLLGSFAMYTDITSRKQAEEEKALLESQLRQSQKMEAIGTLAGGVAHDFNNILMAIIGFASMVQMDLDKEDPKSAYIDQILVAAERAANITHSLLAFSRKQKIDLKHLRISDIVEQTTKLLKRLLTEDIALKVKLDDRNPTILADITQIDQVLINLATNARDAMQNGGTLRIETGIANLDQEFMKLHDYGKPGDYALLAVSDTGTGMDDETKERIFDPFFTTKEVGKGTGLGLSTVYGIVKQHNGYIAVDSVLNKGTTFQVYFPIVHSQKEEASSGPAETPRGKETVLVAEDDRAVRTMIVDILRRYGYTTIEATDGVEALRLFIDNSVGINLIVCDVVMPKMNGKEVYEEIKRTHPHMKFLFTSGYTRDVILGKGLEDGTVDFMAKPIKPREFLTKVREVLDG